MEQKYFKGDKVVFVFWNGEEEHSLDGTIENIKNLLLEDML